MTSRQKLQEVRRICKTCNHLNHIEHNFGHGQQYPLSLASSSLRHSVSIRGHAGQPLALWRGWGVGLRRRSPGGAFPTVLGQKSV